MNVIFRLVSISILLIVLNNATCAQGWLREWQFYNSYSAGHDVEEAMNGDFIVAGYEADLSNFALFVRMTTDGDTVWTKSIKDFEVSEIELIDNDTIVGIGRYFNNPAFVLMPNPIPNAKSFSLA